MLKLRKIIGVLVVMLSLTFVCFAQTSETVEITAEIPTLDGLNVAISRIDVDPATGEETWVPDQTAIDFGTLTYDETSHIFRAGRYYAVDVGVLSNSTTWTITHTGGSIANASGATLDNNINVVFMQQLTNSTANELGKFSYANSNRSYTKSQINPGWLRIYYGIATGSGDAAGVSPITVNNRAGTYTGTITITLTTS